MYQIKYFLLTNLTIGSTNKNLVIDFSPFDLEINLASLGEKK